MVKMYLYFSIAGSLCLSSVQASASNWTDVQRLLATPPEGGDAYGQRVALSGNTAIVAALFNDDVAPNDSGAVYVLERSEEPPMGAVKREPFSYSSRFYSAMASKVERRRDGIKSGVSLPAHCNSTEES